MIKSNKYILSYLALLLLLLSRTLSFSNELHGIIFQFGGFLLLTIYYFLNKNIILTIVGMSLLIYMLNEYLNIINIPYLKQGLLPIIIFLAIVSYFLRFSKLRNRTK